MSEKRTRRPATPSSPRPSGKKKKKQPDPMDGINIHGLALTVAGLKAGIAGGIGVLVLLVLGQTQLRLLMCLIVPGYFVGLIGTGMLAGLLAGDDVQTQGHAMQAAATAGVVSGIIGGITAMLLSAWGVMFTTLGEGIVAQFSAAQLENLAQQGLTPEAIRLVGSVLVALLIWGVGGTILALILTFIGGRIYFRLR